jgi:hypothetical protein
MSRTYQARVSFKVEGVSSRRFGELEGRLSRIVWSGTEMTGAVVVSSVKDREIRFLVAVEATSSSAAESRLDRWFRACLNRLESDAGSSRSLKPTSAKPARPAALEREWVLA